MGGRSRSASPRRGEPGKYHGCYYFRNAVQRYRVGVCIEALRALGLRVCAVGNTPQEAEELLRGVVDVLGSSGRWGVAKPAPFFADVIEAVGIAPREIAYVGDRVDNDVRPARAAGMVAVHMRRCPWGYLQSGSEEADLLISTLAELPERLTHL
jgi:FMN phosphatase YigB (HAD superfamily)